MKQFENRLNKKLNKKLPPFPILGGLSIDPQAPSRNVTSQEAEILLNKGLPVPICIALNKEEEFQAYLKT